jgi:hypothetical protein
MAPNTGIYSDLQGIFAKTSPALQYQWLGALERLVAGNFSV